MTITQKLFQLKHFFVHFLKGSKVIGVDELATVSICTGVVLVVLLAELRLVPRGHMFLFLKLMLSMSKCACFSIGTFIFSHPGLAKFCLNFDLVVFR